jgi:hypothetical protein
VQGAAEFHHQITAPHRPQADAVLHDAAVFDTTVDMRNAPSAIVQGLVGPWLCQGEFLAAWLLGRPEEVDLGQPKRQKAQSLQQPTPRGQGIRRRVSHGLLMGAAASGVTQQEEQEASIDEQDMFARVGLCRAALTCRLGRRVLGADDTPLGAVMRPRGDGGAVTRATGASSRGAPRGPASAASAAEPLRQGRQGASRGIAQGAARRQECREEHVHAWIRCALAHAKPAPVHHLEGRGLQGEPHAAQPIFGCRQGAVLVDRKPAGGPRFPVEAPRRHRRVERRLKGRDEALKRVAQQAGPIQERRGAGLHPGESEFIPLYGMMRL